MSEKTKELTSYAISLMFGIFVCFIPITILNSMMCGDMFFILDVGRYIV